MRLNTATCGRRTTKGSSSSILYLSRCCWVRSLEKAAVFWIPFLSLQLKIIFDFQYFLRIRIRGAVLIRNTGYVSGSERPIYYGSSRIRIPSGHGGSLWKTYDMVSNR
jgi:hypothetical protein